MKNRPTQHSCNSATSRHQFIVVQSDISMEQVSDGGNGEGTPLSHTLTSPSSWSTSAGILPLGLICQEEEQLTMEMLQMLSDWNMPAAALSLMQRGALCAQCSP